MSHETSEDVKEKYLGFFLLRPIPNHPIGRSVISPKALKNNDFLACLADYTINVQGLTLTCAGFPHASQTAETTSCAETTVWNVMEYFSLRYSEYSPTLPSRIHNLLTPITCSRQVPSQGLTMSEISYSLKGMGFSTLLYSKKVYENFDKLLYCYIESGIPVVLGLSSEGNVGHAVTCIGHRKYNYEEKMDISDSEFIDGVTIYDTANLNTDFVVIDDNLPPYQFSPFHSPCTYYTKPDSKSMQIESFVVPLHKNIYLEASKAKRLLKGILNDSEIGFKANTKEVASREYVLRFFLMSSKSLMRCVNHNRSMGIEMKEYLLRLKWPQFVWITEISESDDFLNGLAESLIILDSTGDDTLNSLLFLSYNGIRIVENQNGGYDPHEYDWPKFNQIKNNLKGEWCQWKTTIQSSI